MKTYMNSNITVTALLKSVNVHNGKKMMTLRVKYPRIIHAEKLKHSQLKCNTSSSRAIPVKQNNQYILSDVAMPVRFGKNQSGMQDCGELDNPVVIDGKSYTPQQAWEYAAGLMCKVSDAFADAGYHKQVCNRLTEPFQYTEAVFSGSEWANFFWLRCDQDADPTIKVLADLCFQAYADDDDWQLLSHGQWHLPYVDCKFIDGEQVFYQEDKQLTLQEAKLISMSTCAQASYRKEDNSLEKALVVEGRLFSGKKVHASPSEHQAMAFNMFSDAFDGTGITHHNKQGDLCSGNLVGWVQFRQLINNNVQNDIDLVIDEVMK